MAGSAEPASDCVLCDIAHTADDEDKLVVLRGERAFVVLNLFPYNSGHALIVPLHHAGSLGDLPPTVGAEMWSLTERVVRALGEEYHPDGFNVGMNLGRTAGAGIPDHIHTHIVPRWNGDTNFMPVLADAKVLPESLQQTWARLRRALTAE